MAIWILAVAVADLFAGPHGHSDGDSPARPARATVALAAVGIVAAATGG